MKKINLIVPFYKNPHLVDNITKSLVMCQDELINFNINVIYYNDSPSFKDLEIALKEINNKYLIKFNLRIINNTENLGFVKTVNNAFEDAITEKSDVILLNSDTRVYPGAISELCTVAYLDYMTGFVSPRSNNATICTYPHGAENLSLTSDQLFEIFKKTAFFLPRQSYVPTAVGFCLYIKNSIISELGGFDPIYGKGYNEENDLIFRANRKGYKAVLANHAFVYHEGEQSFNTSNENKNILEKRNHEILINRYPEYTALIQRYFISPVYLAESSLSKISLSNNNEINIAFDFSTFTPIHNGTYEAGKAIISAASKSWPSNYKIFVISTLEVWDFHNYSDIDGIQRISPRDYSFNIHAIIKIGQPFNSTSVEQLIYTAPIVCVNMLDTIAADCGNLSISLDEEIWHFTMKWSNIIYTISKFSEAQLLNRFKIGVNTKVSPILLSTNPKDYYNKIYSQNNHKQNTILIIGNSFEHKGLSECAKILSNELPDFNFIILGNISHDLPNVQQINSGNLTESKIQELYESVDCMVYPSYYEGFGFPVMHALAHKKPLLLRNIPVFKEISESLTCGNDNLIWFENNKQLVQILKKGMPKWIGEDAIGDPDGWTRVANETLEVLKLELNRIDFHLIEDRFRWYNLIFKPSNYNQKNIFVDSIATLKIKKIKYKLSKLTSLIMPNFIKVRLIKLIKKLFNQIAS